MSNSTAKMVAPWAALAATVATTVVMLRWQGRLWRCACGRAALWVSDAWSGETSQHVFDPYSFSHVLHGLIFCGAVMLAAPRLSRAWQLWIAVTLEAAWEIFENSRFVIDRYRETAALGYNGDTIVNSLGDIVACAIGFLLARHAGWRVSLGLLIVIEVMMLLLIRDSLFLNIVMLIYPFESIKLWQAGS